MWGQWSGFLLEECCVQVVFLVVPVWKSVGDRLTGKWSWVCGLLVQEFDDQGAPMQAEWAASHG